MNFYQDIFPSYNPCPDLYFCSCLSSDGIDPCYDLAVILLAMVSDVLFASVTHLCRDCNNLNIGCYCIWNSSE